MTYYNVKYYEGKSNKLVLFKESRQFGESRKQNDL